MKLSDWQSLIGILAIAGINILGYWMVLPVFTLFASGYHGATPVMVGLALGAYGPGYAIFQFLWGPLSYRFNRKVIITITLIIFGLGSALCAKASTIDMVVWGRFLQGAGCAFLLSLALLGDLVKQQDQSKMLVLSGVMGVVTFALALMIGPAVLYGTDLSGVFSLSAVLAILAIACLWIFVPSPKRTLFRPYYDIGFGAVCSALFSFKYLRVYIAIFCIQALFVSLFYILPLTLSSSAHLSKLYLVWFFVPVALIAFCLLVVLTKYLKTNTQAALLLSGFFLLICVSFIWLRTGYIWFDALAVILGVCALLIALHSMLGWFHTQIETPKVGTCKALAIFFHGFGACFGGVETGFLLQKHQVSGVLGFMLILTLLWLVLVATLARTSEKRN